MLKKSNSILVLLLTVALIAVTGYFAANIVQNTGDGNGIILGLDLAGGVSITYEVVGDTPTESEMSDTIFKLQKRVETYSTEAQVYQEGEDRIIVEIPGVTDANEILEALGKPGSLTFQDPDGNDVIDGTDIANASAEVIQNDLGNKEYVVGLEFTAEGTKKFADLTSANIGKNLPIVYDGETISNPTVQTAITGGTAQISGMESYEAAERLASQIRIGSLSVELSELRSSVVGAQLGKDALRTSLIAAMIGIGIIMVFMMIVYLVPGIATSLALLLYTFLTVIIIYAFDITLTLPGIAGVILSIGMAVDANVIIFARVKEELAAGKSVASALKIGFKKATSAIVDGNVTTLIAAVVLGMMGSGTVKGFAMTLGLGIVLSMFSALLLTRYIIYALYGVGIKSEKCYRAQKQRKVIDFVSKKVVFFIIAIAAILSGFVAMGIHAGQGDNALNFSLEFMGGTSTNITFDEDKTVDQIEKDIIPVVQKAINDTAVQAQAVTGENQVVIKTKILSLEEREALNQAMVDEFGVDESLIQSENISSTISSEMREDAVVAVVIAIILMLIYIWIRFKDLRFGASAIIALIHDVLVVLACYAIVRISVGNTFIACMLTIVGYSINATIVIFDRIRENQLIIRSADRLAELVNTSITQTLTRSIYTSFTTFVTIAALYILGVSSIKEFALPLMVGIVAGMFSSVCLTGIIWYMMKRHIGAAKEAETKKGAKAKKA